MVSINPVATTGPVSDDPSWIATEFGIGSNRTVTLDLSAFTAEDHYPDGFIPSGTALGKITASGLYGPYDNAVDPADGTEVFAGFLYHPVVVEDPAGVDTAAMMVRGDVEEANLPAAIDSAAKTDNPNISYR